MKKIKIFPLFIAIFLIFSAAAPAGLALEEPEIGAKAAVIVDMETGRVIYERDKDQQRAPASLTKVMTALLALEAVEEGRASLGDMITAQPDCRQGLDESSSTSGIVPGLTLSLEELLYSALLQSANEACNVIASHIAGSIDAFVTLMNNRAQELGCVNTNFLNTNGLPAEGHYSSAYDLYLITKEALKYPIFLEICNTQSHQCPVPEVNGGEPMQNSNALINPGSIYGSGYVYEGASGIKTGYTRAAGYCLISTAQREGINVMAVILGCDGYLNANIDEYRNFDDSITAYDWVFDNFEYRDILSAADPVGKVEVLNSKGGSMAIVRPSEDVRALLPKDLLTEDIVTTPHLYSDSIEAPVKAGQVLGEISVNVNGEEYGSVQLINSTEVELAKGRLLMMRLKELFTSPWLITVLVIVLVFALIYIALRLRYNRAKREHIRRRREMERRRAEEERQRWIAEHENVPISRGSSGYGEDYDEYDGYGEYEEDYGELSPGDEGPEGEGYVPQGSYYQDPAQDMDADDSLLPEDSSWEDILK